MMWIMNISLFKYDVFDKNGQIFPFLCSQYQKDTVFTGDLNMPNNALAARHEYTHTVRKGRFLITICHNPKKEQRKLAIANNERSHQKQPNVIKKGRFLVTEGYVVFENEQPEPKQTTIVKQNRSEDYVVLKHEQPKQRPPTVTRKGRFLITHH